MVKKRKKTYKYKIIITNQGKEVGKKNIGLYTDLPSAMDAYNKIIEESNKVIYPIRYLNITKVITKAKYEVVLLKKRDIKTKDNYFSNEYGKQVKAVIISTDQWVIYEKHAFNKEETFWVYGYNPINDRKTYNFILNNLILNNINDRYNFKEIIVFKNKLLIKYDNDFDMVLCKNYDDCVRLYTEIKSKCYKIKTILFGGLYKKGNYKIETEIVKKTGWTYKKANRRCTKP
jgi:hypothetical protein